MKDALIGVVDDGRMNMMLTVAGGRGMMIVVDGGRIVGVMVYAMVGEWMVGLSNVISVIEGCDRFNISGDGALIVGCVLMGGRMGEEWSRWEECVSEW